MNWESNERLWKSLLAVHRFLTKDFVDKLNYATEITDDDVQPLFNAYQVLQKKQFRLDSEVFHLSRKAIEEVHQKLLEFLETNKRQSQARDSGDRPLQQTLLEQMNVQYNRLVQDFEQHLHDIKAAAEKSLREFPKIHLPSLEYVGGGITVDSPTTTHITSTIDRSPGAIANVAQYMTAVANQVTQQVNESAASEEVKELIKQLANQITAIDPAINPAKVQEMTGDLKTLSDEMAKAEPRRKWYELSLEGIKEAAQAIGEIGKPVIETVMKLMPLLVPA